MDPFWCTVAILVHLHLARGCDSTQLILTKTSSDMLYVSEGHSYTLHCEYNAKIRECSWSRDRTPVKIRDRYQYATGNGLDTNSCTFFVESAEKSMDNARWQCAACATSDYGGVESNEITVIVVPKPEIRWKGTEVTRLYAPWAVTANVDLKCIFQNNMSLSSLLYWTADETRLSESSYSSELRWDENSNFQNHKRITCTAENSMFGHSVSQPLNILPHKDRKLNVSVNGELVTKDVEVGDLDKELELTCASDGQPKPIFRWMYKKDEKVDSWKFYLEDDHSSQRAITTKRVGFFRCVAFDQRNETNVTSDLVIHIVQLKSEINAKLLFIIGGIVIIALVKCMLVCFLTVRMVSRRRDRRSAEINVGEEAHSPEQWESDAIQIPPPPTIPLPSLPPRSTSLVIPRYMASVPSSPRSKRLPPPPANLHTTGSFNTLHHESSSATMRSGHGTDGVRKAPRPIPRRVLNMETARQQDGSGYVMPDRPDLLISNSNKANEPLEMDKSFYSTIVSFDNHN